MEGPSTSGNNPIKWPCLRSAGCSIEEIETGILTSGHTLELLNNGAAYELSRLKISWPKKASYLRTWMGSTLPPTVTDRQIRNVLEKTVKERAKILTNKKPTRHAVLASFLTKPFFIPSYANTSTTETTQVGEDVEEKKTEAKLLQTKRLLKNSSKRENNKSKLIKQQKMIIRENKESIRRLIAAKKLQQSRTRKRQQELQKFRKLKFRQASTNKSTQTPKLVEECKQCIKFEIEMEKLKDVGTSNMKKISLTEGRVYTPHVVECVLTLLSRFVAYEHVGPVMRAVLKMVRLDPEEVPSRSTVERMAHLRLPLAHLNAATVFLSDTDTTLYSDETCKTGKQFETYVVTSESQRKILGLREITDKSASTNLETLKEVIGDFERCGSDVGKQILAHIKNTMSDRAACEKSFQQHLALYRREILPEVIPKLDIMSNEDRQQCSKMHNFYCGLHLLVNAAGTANKALMSFEEKHRIAHHLTGSEFKMSAAGESDTVHLVRACSKAFAPGGDEKNGCYGDARIYLKAKGETHTLARFKGNRFNIVFHNAGLAYCHKDHYTDFLDNCHGTPNGLLSTVSRGLKSALLVAGMRALGVIGKRLTKPLWQEIERQGSILEMNNIYAEMINTIETASGQSIMAGSVLLVSSRPAKSSAPDKTLAALTCPAASDALTVQILEYVLAEIKILFQHLLKDQLPGGVHAEKTNETNPECMSSLKHNKIPETVFGQLDYLKKTKPSATTLTHESTVMYNFNKVGEWLQSMGEEGLHDVMRKASVMRKFTDVQFKERLSVIEHKKKVALQKKADDLAKKAQKILQEKTNLTDSVVFHGLWQSPEQVDLKLSTYRTQTAKKEALRCQLNFRKKVLLQIPSSPDLFTFSKNRVGKTVEQLTNNIKKLIDESSAAEQVTSVDGSSLVGARIDHRFEENGGMVTYRGNVISQVPGFPRWFNVVYECEPDTVYTFRLEEDLARQDLWIVE